MKAVVISVAIVSASLVHAEGTNRLTRSGSDAMLRLINAGQSCSPLILAGEDGETLAMIMEPLQSPSLHAVLPDATAYRLICSQDIMHGATFSALLVDANGSPSHLQTDHEVAYALHLPSKKVRSKEDALRVVRAFADLRSYKIVETPPDFPDKTPPEKRTPPAATDYKFLAEEHESDWRVYATLFTSEYSGRCERYVFKIYKWPGSGLSVELKAVIRLRNYVY